MFTDTTAVNRFAELQREYGFETLIETGTHLGVGSLTASRFCTVFTAEINPDFRAQAEKRWLENYFVEVEHEFYPFNEHMFQNKKRNIYSALGNAPEVVDKWLENHRFDRPACFYLDAHWPGTTILNELEVIAKHGLSDSVIICHDFLVPGKEDRLRCDEYNGVKLSYDFVKDLLAKINPEYRIEYNDESSTGVGIMYALPPKITLPDNVT